MLEKIHPDINYYLQQTYSLVIRKALNKNKNTSYSHLNRQYLLTTIIFLIPMSYLYYSYKD